MPTCFDSPALSLSLAAHNGHQHFSAQHHLHQQQQQQQQHQGEPQATSSSSPPQPLSTSGSFVNGRAIRYYQPLMDAYPPLHHHHHHHHSLPYANLNQKRESVITFSSNNSVQSLNNNASSSSSPKALTYSSSQLELDDHLSKDSLALTLSERGCFKLKANLVCIEGLPFTLEQIVCICQVLQKCDLNKLEKFIYTLPADSKLAKNELILRARTIAAYYSGNYKLVYDILENNHFSVKYHQELQNIWNNAHYKEHELKRGHPPGAVEKYRIRKKYQFPRTIWDGEEYVYCFKEKNRRILKEFYLKCNLPTQEDKLKLSNQTQLTVVQISNWFKNRRQRDRQPNHEHEKTSTAMHCNLASDQSSLAPTPSPPTRVHHYEKATPFPIESLVSAHHAQHSHAHSHHLLGGPSSHRHHLAAQHLAPLPLAAFSECSPATPTSGSGSHPTTAAASAARSYYLLPQ